MRCKITYAFVLCIGLNFLSYTDSFAQIPTISIQTDNEIVDEPKVLGMFTYTGTDGEMISSNIGIEIRGGFSQTYPKKTYDIEFWEDDVGEETNDVQFGNLRDDDDWILDAMYNEPLRINSYMAHKLWLDINQLYYQNEESKAKSGADVMYVEVTINDEYQGIYLLSEQVDRSLLKLKKNTNTEIRGEMYKSYTWDDAILFNQPDETPNNNSLTWSGFEYRYPTDIVDWSNVEDLVDFVVNSSDEDFALEIGSRFNLENVMDYFIFLNLARLLDNRGKNIYLCRYDANEPYFFAPWDLDGSWGLLWNGTNDTNTDDILTNRLFDRVIETDVNGYRQKILDRWAELRASFISDSALDDRINEAHQFLLDNEVYDKEGEVWEYEYSINDLNYMFDWLGDRLDYLDGYFKNITDVNELEEVSNFNIYPNPANDYIIVSGGLDVISKYRVYNVLGGLKIENSTTLKGNRIYVNDLSSGIYILEIGGNRKLFYKL